MPPRLSPALRLSKYSLSRELKSIPSRPLLALHLPQYSQLRELKSIPSLSLPPTSPPAPKIFSDNYNSKVSKNQKARGRWDTSYSKMAMDEAWDTLGIDIQNDCISHTITVDRMLAEANLKCGIKDIGSDAIKRTKEKVYARIVEYLEFEGYPSGFYSNFIENGIHDLVLSILSPILADFKKETGHNIQLQREAELIWIDSETRHFEEQQFIMVDKISIKKQSFVLIIEGDCHRYMIRLCSLMMRDMWNNNRKGEVYGFVTSGDIWKIMRYDGTTFRMAEKFYVMFNSMGKAKDRWMKENSILVDCITAALRSGGTL